MLKKKRMEFGAEVLFLAGILLFLLCWALVQPFNVSPDEAMRFRITDYIFRHGTLPHGGDPEVRDAAWGISYGFNPVLAYMIAAAFMKVASLFSESGEVLLMAARVANVMFGCGFAFLVRRIAGRLFDRAAGWFFTAAVTILPGCLFVFSYVNTDGLALFSTALILLMWVRAYQEDWTWKTCTGLGIGIGLCALSYYNAYGVILASIVFFVCSILACRQKKWDVSFLLSRGLLIAGIVFLIAGWWFIRSYIIYDGDILGMRTSSQYAEQFAIEELKPSNRYSIVGQGMSLLQMMFLVPGGWQHNWLITVIVSFIGTFGYMTVFMPYALSKAYVFLFGIGALGLLGAVRKLFFLRKDRCLCADASLGGERVQARLICCRERWNMENLFRLAMLLAVIVPPLLLIWYAYYSDFQAQGRYVLPALIPIMYFVTLGFEQWFGRIDPKGRIRPWFYRAAVLFLLVAAVYTYRVVFLPSLAV